MSKNIKLHSMRIKNFRCFTNKPSTIVFNEDNDVTGILGDNSTGKTTILQALLKVFSNDPQERALIKSDFNMQSTNEVKERRASDLLLYDSTLIIEVTLVFPKLRKPEENDQLSKNLYLDEKDNKVKMTIRLTGYWGKYKNGEEDIDQKIQYMIPSDEPDIDDLVPAFKALHTEMWDRLIHRKLVQMLYIQPKRGMKQELFNRLLNVRTFSKDEEEQIEKVAEQLNVVFQEKTEEIHRQLTGNWKYLNKGKLTEEIALTVMKPIFAEITKQLSVRFSKDTNIEQISDGMQSLFYFAIIQTILEKYNNQDHLVIIAFEEPENYIAPSSRGQIMNLLNKISKGNAQIILTTHSPSVVKRLDPKSMILIQIESNVHKINKVNFSNKKENLYKFIRGAVYAYPELYFGKLIILGEGESELIVLPKLIENLGKNGDDYGIVYVPLGGAHVNYMWKLLSDLSIPFITLLDLDLGRQNGGWKKINYVIKQLKDNDFLTDEQLIDVFNSSKSFQPNDSKGIDKMLEWSLKGEEETLRAWIEYLKEKHSVIFSEPLDLDFMMLKEYQDYYSLLCGRIQKGAKEAKESLLKDEDALEYYSNCNNDLFAQYWHLFKSKKGKPAVHIQALEDITLQLQGQSGHMPDHIPDPINKIHKLIGKKLGIQE
ncbi:ATP-dependent nuclease [Bacillus pretiosus]|uniref:ATP-dependent nuclease n=1 Tax=Bacillus pretiosus TaxID=2983392 RepID=UPI003D301D33